ncbi:MAG: hypothetical protein JWL76_1397 [Thermoleophilia bacterium]|nr:hypothetical protein [Thermoleophilia bacterium]
MDDVQQRRIAKNEDHCRQANEAIFETMVQFQGAEEETLSLVCECGISECLDTVEASLSEYNAVREHPTRFIVRPDHVIAQVENVVQEHQDYWIIQKVGAGADVAEQRYAGSHTERSGAHRSD